MGLFEPKRLANDEEYSICLKPLAEFLISECEPETLAAFLRTHTIPQFLVSSGKSQEEGAVMLRAALDFFAKKKGRFDPESVLPDPAKLDEIVQHYMDENGVFVLRELLFLIPHYNSKEPTIGGTLLRTLERILRNIYLEGVLAPKEEAGATNPLSENTESLRREYSQLVQDQLDIHRRDLVPRNMGDIVNVAVRMMKIVLGDENGFRGRILGYISDLQEQIRDIRMKRQELLHKLESQPSQSQGTVPASKSPSDESSQHQQQQFDTEESFLTIRALKLAVGLLQISKSKIGEDVLEGINDALVRPIFATGTNDEFVKFLGTQYLGLYALADMGMSQTFFPIFRGLIQGIADFQSLQSVAALKAIFDILLVHNKSMHKAKEQTPAKAGSAEPVGEIMLSTLEELRQLFYAPNAKLRLLVYEGFAKLVFCDRVPMPEKHLVPLFLVLCDLSENESEANAIKQIVTLALKNYTRLAASRCRKLSRALVVFTLLCVRTNVDSTKVPEDTVLGRIRKCQYSTLISYLVYLLTPQYLATEKDPAAAGSQENLVAETLVHVLKAAILHPEVVLHLGCVIDICLRFLELRNASKALWIVLYKHWSVFVSRTQSVDRNFYRLGFLLRNVILKKDDGPRAETGEEESEQDEDRKYRETQVDQIIEGMSKEIEDLSERLEKKYRRIERVSNALFQDFSTLRIVPEKGCVRVVPARPQYQTGILTTDCRRAAATLSGRKNWSRKKSDRLGAILETPRGFRGSAVKRQVGKRDRSDSTSGKLSRIDSSGVITGKENVKNNLQ